MSAADPPPTRPRARRALGLAAASLLGLAAAGVLAAPGVPATCARIVTLVEATGESVDAADRDACERRYAELGRRRGRLGWAQLAWCTRFAASLAEAGAC